MQTAGSLPGVEQGFKTRIHLPVTFPARPCSLSSLDFQPGTGQKERFKAQLKSETEAQIEIVYPGLSEGLCPEHRGLSTALRRCQP